MGEEDARATVERFWAALAADDRAGAAEMLAEDVVVEWPQSGERIVGRANWLGMATGHPAFPTITPQGTEGSGDLWVTYAHYEYPVEGGPAPFEVCAVQRVKGGPIIRLTEYYAEPFEPAAWRERWVERTR
jgi:ketosteroid isomerase-like protein